MMLSRPGLIATGLAVAGVAGVGALAYAAVGSARHLPRLAAERGRLVAAAEAGDVGGADRVAQAGDSKAPAVKDALPAPKAAAAPSKPKPAPRETTSRETAPTDRKVHVAAPDTDVNVDKERGNVRVRAPYTKVDVDPDRGQVRVRAPYVNLDVRW